MFQFGVKADMTKGQEEVAQTNPAGTTSAESKDSDPAKGAVNVSSNPAGAGVVLDGAFFGNCPASLKFTTGKHSITVKAAGYKDWSRDINVQAGSEVQLTANLEKQ